MSFPAKLFSPLKVHRATTPVVIGPQLIIANTYSFMRAAGQIVVWGHVYIFCRAQSAEAAEATRVRRALVLLFAVVLCVSISACTRNFGQGR